MSLLKSDNYEEDFLCNRQAACICLKKGPLAAFNEKA